MSNEYPEIKDLLGQIITKIDVNRNSRFDVFGEKSGTDDHVIFTLSDGRMLGMYHEQSCCEYVHIDDINGSLSDLLNTPILRAEEKTNCDSDKEYDSFTYTFYDLATKNGCVTLRWFGSSNGYYSESVNFTWLK